MMHAAVKQSYSCLLWIFVNCQVSVYIDITGLGSDSEVVVVKAAAVTVSTNIFCFTDLDSQRQEMA